MHPPFLYKILSLENWQASQGKPQVRLADDDANFIHLSTEDQLERILKKYWSCYRSFVQLKVDTAKLLGRIVYEANPGGANKYYHLYDGAIPLTSIIEVKILTNTFEDLCK